MRRARALQSGFCRNPRRPGGPCLRPAPHARARGCGRRGGRDLFTGQPAIAPREPALRSLCPGADWYCDCTRCRAPRLRRQRQRTDPPAGFRCGRGQGRRSQPPAARHRTRLLDKGRLWLRSRQRLNGLRQRHLPPHPQLVPSALLPQLHPRSPEGQRCCPLHHPWTQGDDRSLPPERRQRTRLGLRDTFLPLGRSGSWDSRHRCQ